MSEHPLTTWAARLRHAAERSLATPQGRPPGGVFVDESGHRRAVDGPFFAWRSRARIPAKQGAATPEPRAWTDVGLWRAVADVAIPLEPLLAQLADVQGPDAEPIPLTPPHTGGAIEVWTESELCALHALWRLGRLRARPDLIDRCLSATRWHVEHLQPDNATNHPWAIHTFAVAAQHLDSFEHELHAQAMLHTCQVTLGRPDALSAHILLDAAECLEEEAAHTP